MKLINIIKTINIITILCLILQINMAICNELTIKKLKETINQNNFNEGKKRQLKLLEFINDNENKNEYLKLEMVNNFFNSNIYYASDMEVWGQIDYWATPLESLNKGAGDCEDYAIGKYYTLISMGVDRSKLKLVYVKFFDGISILPHMVLSYTKENSDVLILDNLMLDIKLSTERKDLTPVFSFNDEGLYLEISKKVEHKTLSKWEDLINKANKEGWYSN